MEGNQQEALVRELMQAWLGEALYSDGRLRLRIHEAAYGLLHCLMATAEGKRIARARSLALALRYATTAGPLVSFIGTCQRPVERSDPGAQVHELCLRHDTEDVQAMYELEFVRKLAEYDLLPRDVMAAYLLYLLRHDEKLSEQGVAEALQHALWEYEVTLPDDLSQD